MNKITQQCAQAAAAAPLMGTASALKKNQALHKMADQLTQQADVILNENKKDTDAAQKNGIGTALLDRLTLTQARIQAMADSLNAIARDEDPIGEIIHGWKRPNELTIQQIRVPLGVVGIIYEARPNVTADAIGIAIKTGNCVVLRGSASAYHSNKIITTICQSVMKQTGLPDNAIQLLEDTRREGVLEFVQMKDYLNVVIPRGGAELIQNVIQHATVPTIETGVGNCHTYIDKSADIPAAIAIVENAKVQRPSVCNACETVLIHTDIAKTILPKLVETLIPQGVELRGCPTACSISPQHIIPATEADWDTEYLDLILAVKIVPSTQDAILHIQKHTTHHSEAILSNDARAIHQFKTNIDAAAIVVNASTRFVDGGEFGFGAEMGISTQKLHVRGPMGLKALTSIKYIVEGDGQIRK